MSIHAERPFSPMEGKKDAPKSKDASKSIERAPTTFQSKREEVNKNNEEKQMEISRRDAQNLVEVQQRISLLNRNNERLRGMGRPEQISLSETAYDKTQTPSAQEAKEQARSESVEAIADNALRANIEALAREQATLAQAQENANNASFLTRWRYNAQVKDLQEQMRFREAAIRARKAQLEQGTEETIDTQKRA